MARVDEIVDGIYRICTPVDVGGFDFQFNQFLIDDERPALIHTGMHGMYDDVRSAVAQVLDPGKLQYVALLHFESDECGGMYRFLDGAPDSTMACSAASVQLNLAHESPVRAVVDRIEQLDPSWIHGMHGGSLARETIPGFVRALREEP